MKTKFYPFALLLSILVFSCEPTQKEIADDLEKEVIARHDEAMAKIDHIRKTIKVIEKEKKDLLEHNEEHHAAKIDECDKAMLDLDMADKDMFDWMHQYAEASKATRTDEERITFYKEELVKINAVYDEIITSIHEGEHFVRMFYDDIADKQKHDHELEEKQKEQSFDKDSTANADVEV